MSRRPLALAVASLALLALAAPAGAQSDQAQRLAGPAWRVALLAEDAWGAATPATRGADSWSDDIRADLLAFAGAARFTAERLSRGETTEAQGAELVRTLERVASTTQQTLDRLRASEGVRRAFFEARGSLSALSDLQAGRTAPAGPGSTQPVPTQPAPTQPAPQPTAPIEPAPPVAAPIDPDAPRAEITETRWKKAFKPDLVVSGFVEGRGLKTAELQLVDSAGQVLYRESAKPMAAIAAATSGLRDTMLSTAEFEIGISNSEIPSGEVMVVIVVRDAKGREGRAETSVTRRLF